MHVRKWDGRPDAADHHGFNPKTIGRLMDNRTLNSQTLLSSALRVTMRRYSALLSSSHVTCVKHTLEAVEPHRHICQMSPIGTSVRAGSQHPRLIRRRCSALHFFPHAAMLLILQLPLTAVTEGFHALSGSHPRRSSACGSASHAIVGAWSFFCQQLWQVNELQCPRREKHRHEC